MQSRSFECPICFTHYDLHNHLPRILPWCGHSLCQSCLRSILFSGPYRCPLDNRRFGSTAFDSFPPNYTVRGLLEEQSKEEFCLEHEEKIRFGCLTDRCALCACCVLINHQGHTIKPITEIRLTNDAKRDKLEKDLEAMDQYLNEVSEQLKTKKTVFISKVDTRFKEIVDLLSKEKRQIELAVKCFFSEEDNRITKMIQSWGYIKEKTKDCINKNQDSIFSNWEIKLPREFLEGPQAMFDKEAYFQRLDSNIAKQVKDLEEISLIQRDKIEKLCITFRSFHEDLDKVCNQFARRSAGCKASVPQGLDFIVKRKKFGVDLFPTKKKVEMNGNFVQSLISVEPSMESSIESFIIEEIETLDI